MKKQQIRTSALAALVLTIIAVVILMNKAESENVEKVAIQKPLAQTTPVAPVPLEPVTVNKVAPLKTVLMESALTAPEKKQLSEHLDLFHELDVKVLMNPQERERYVALLNDSQIHTLIRKAVLRADKNNRQIQDRSAEFVVSAIKSDVDVSSLVKEIISDASIESESVPKETRQVQAELKAEILYAWTSYNPSAAVSVASLLPGPVSQRLWNNIIQTQANNVEESLTVH